MVTQIIKLQKKSRQSNVIHNLMQNKNTALENFLKNITFNQNSISQQNESQEIQILNNYSNFQQLKRLVNEQRDEQLKQKADQQSSDDQEHAENEGIPKVEANLNDISINQQSSQKLFQYLRNVSTSQKTYKNVEDIFAQINFSQIQNQILQNRQFQKCSSFQTQFSIISIQPTKYYQIVTIWIQCGWYKTKVVILNYASKANDGNPLHHCAHINNFGAFGNIYFIQYLKEKYGVKCIPISQNKQNSENYFEEVVDSIASAIKEYFFLKLFSELKIGPKLKQSFGFDLIISHNCIEFSMQLCRPFLDNPENEKKIIENMKKMHILQIVHRDIKKDNLMWSQEFQSPVFIDFGLTTFIKERLGSKSITRFAGTMGFVSPQMNKIFVQKKGIVDLYYNDLYGINQSFHFLKKFSNMQNFMDTHKKPTKLRDQTFTIHLLKYNLLAKNYSEFGIMWQELQKYHFYELESIEYAILQFMIDLRPNGFLSRLYRQISEQSRALKEFEGLRDVYMSELSTILSIWTKFPQKSKKFEGTVYIYKQISAVYLIGQQIEKKIEKILIGSQSLMNFMKQKQQNIIDNNFSQQNIMIYFVVLAYYCTIAHNKYEISLEDKIQAAKFALKVINDYGFLQKVTTENLLLQKQRIKVFILSLSKLWFVCPLTQLQPIGIVYQYLMFHLWSELPPRFKNQILGFIISSLSLMGYPFYIEAATDVFKYYLFKDKKSFKLNAKTNIQDRLTNISLYWRSISIINVYSQICYNRQQTNFVFDKQISYFMQSEVQKFQKSLMHQNNDNSFFILNHHFYQFHTKTKVSQYPSDLIIKILQQLEKQNFVLNTEINWSIYYSQYKESIRLLFNFLPGRTLMPLQLGIIHESNPITLEYEESIDMTLHFSSFLKFCINSWNLQRVGKVLKIISETIVYEKLTERFYVDFRIYVAWKMLDISAMKKITALVVEATQNISLQNLNYLKTIGMITHKILLLERKGFWDLIIQKLICYEHLEKVINRMRKYIQFYTRVQNLPQPDDILPPLEKIIHLKNVKYKQRYCVIDECTVVNLILNQTEDKLYKTFDSVQTIVSLISSLLRYAMIFLDQGLKKQYHRLLPNRSQVDIVTHLRSILPQKLKKSLFISKETQNQYSTFLKISINVMSSNEVSLSKYYNANWNQNNRLLMQIPIEYCQDFNTMVRSFNNAYQQQELFKRVSTNSIVTEMKPSPRVGVIYYLSKLIANKQQNLNDYRELISFYKLWSNHYEVYKVMFETQMIKYLVNAFVYCEVPFDQFLQLLLDIASFVKSIQDKFAVQIFRQAVWDKFFCVCSYCFPFPPPNWKPLQFIKHIYANRFKFTQSSHPYIGMVLIAATPNQFTPLNIKKKFVKFAIKCLEYLPSNARQYIMQHVYFQIFILKLIDKGLYQPPEYNQQLIEIKPQVKVVYNDKIIRSEYYHAEKYFKSQKRVGDINRLIHQRYKVKRKRIPGWRLPEFIEKIYHKKLHRYHLFVNGFEENVKIQPHVQLLKQIQF